MAARPFVTVQLTADAKKPVVLPLPTVLTAPIRLDVVTAVHTSMNKNRRQPYAVNVDAGMQVAAESWGTGRAVARIPRVPGGGTSRSGQGAFGNMCRGGRMFSPTKTWRRWHRKINTNQRRFALASALAASALPALVMARGHKIDNVPEVPLVLSTTAIKEVNKTKAAAALLEKVHALADVDKVKDSKKIRRGKGKMRNRRYVARKGPLVIYDSKDNVGRGFRNLSGVDLCHVERLNLLQLAPGGHVGRFIVWTQNAFARLDSIYGTNSRQSKKVDYHLPRHSMTNPDITRIINSDEVQSHLRATRPQRKYHTLKKNPLTNLGAMIKLNPYASTVRRRQLLQQEKAKKDRAALVQARRQKAAEKGKKGGVKPKAPKTKKPAVKKTVKKVKVSALKKKNAHFHKLLLS